MYVFNIFIIEHYVRYLNLFRVRIRFLSLKLIDPPGYNRRCKLTLW